MADERYTILDDLNDILGSQENIDLIYDTMLQDSYVQRDGLTPTRESVQAYFRMLRAGVDYAGIMFGSESLPSGIQFCGESHYQETGQIVSNVMAYAWEEDSVDISMYHLALWCTYYEAPMPYIVTERFPDYMLLAATQSFLEGVEECYHGYQIKHLGYAPVDTMFNRDHLLEREITPILLQAMSKMKLPLYAVDEAGGFVEHDPLDVLRALENSAPEPHVEAEQQLPSHNKPSDRPQSGHEPGR